jgi:hypothetical protein
MFNLFKKKESLEDYLIKVVKSPMLNFQIDIFRRKVVEIQIIRQRMLKELGIPFDQPEGLAFSICFEDSQSLKRFKESEFLNIGFHQKKFGEVYFFFCDNNVKKIGDLLYKIQTKVYNYKADTVYKYRFIRHP